MNLILKPYNSQYKLKITPHISPKYLKKYNNRLFPFIIWNLLRIEYNDFYILVNEVNDEIVGYIDYRIKRTPFSNARLYIYGVEIIKEMRGKGYGTILMDKALSILKDWNNSEVYLYVSRYNVTAINLYDKYLFADITKNKNAERLLMKKDLNGEN